MGQLRCETFCKSSLIPEYMADSSFACFSHFIRAGTSLIVQICCLGNGNGHELDCQVYAISSDYQTC